MPLGMDDTVPVPAPAAVTESWNVGTTALNVAVTLCAAFIVTVQVGVVPLHAPDHPPNVLPGAGAAANATCVPAA